MCRYPSSRAQRTAFTVVGPLGTCQTPRPSTGMEYPSASTRSRLSAVFEAINVSPFVSAVLCLAELPGNYDVSPAPVGMCGKWLNVLMADEEAAVTTLAASRTAAFEGL